jgi:hypothetical protein
VSTLRKVAISAGGIVLSMMVGDAATKFADTKIDEMSEKFVVNKETV